MVNPASFNFCVVRGPELALAGMQREVQAKITAFNKEYPYVQSLLVGAGVGLAFGLHRYRNTSSLKRSCDFALGSFFFTSTAGYCVVKGNLLKEEIERKDHLQQQIKELQERAATRNKN